MSTRARLRPWDPADPLPPPHTHTSLTPPLPPAAPALQKQDAEQWARLANLSEQAGYKKQAVYCWDKVGGWGGYKRGEGREGSRGGIRSRGGLGR